jgi:hypothetical protein
MDSSSGNGAEQVPLVIGVTGHRDLVPAETEALRAAVARFFTGLREQFPDVPFLVVTSLAIGADLLVAEEAFALGIDCTAILPMPVESYREDFPGAEDLRRFESALSRCRQTIVLPAPAGGAERSARYAASGEMIASDAFILLALWDGKPPPLPGGTASTVEFRLSQRAWLNDVGVSEPRELLPRLPPDLVYHIVVSRLSGTPVAGLAPLQQGYRSTINGPLEAHLPDTAFMIAERTAVLDRDLKRYHAEMAPEILGDGLIGDLTSMPPNVEAAARLFSAVDWVARRMQRYVVRTLVMTSCLSLLMGLFFMLYSHSNGEPPDNLAIFGFITVFVLLFIANRRARKLEWHRRYLEYRTLAEGLRVEFFWAIAGVHVRGATAAAHRTLLKQSDTSLEWIPNAIRAAGLMLKNIRAEGIRGGVEFAMSKWVGSDDQVGRSSEQLRYYKHASHSKGVRATLAESLAHAAAMVGLLLAVVLAVEIVTGKDAFHAVLLAVMGLAPLLSGVIEAWVQKTAARELERKYEYMHDVFRAAHDRLLAANTDDERRTVLGLLGRSALAEHADWLLIHRDRPIDRSRMQ